MTLTRAEDVRTFEWDEKTILPGDVIVVTITDRETGETVLRTGPVRWTTPFNGFYRTSVLGTNSLRSLKAQGFTLASHYEAARG